jgi:hypothetical protein
VAGIAGAAPPQATKPPLISPRAKPTWQAHRLPRVLPGKPPKGPRLVVLEPAVGALLTGQWPYSTHKWELFWHVQNQGPEATRMPATLRIKCEVVNVDWASPLGSDLVAGVCGQAEGTFPVEPLAAGATSTRRYRTLLAPIPNATCGPSNTYPRLTAKVEPAPSEKGTSGVETLVLDFCR